jgi:protein gp37
MTPTPIEWTNFTWQVVTGCQIKSAGCKSCYAMRLAGGRLRNHPSRAGLTMPTAAGPVWTGEVRFNEQWLFDPLAIKKPAKIFVVAHGDLFYEAVPDAWIDKVVVVMLLAHWHQFQCLTKRPDRMAAYFVELATPAGLHRLERVARELGYTLCFDNRSLHDWLPAAHILLGTSVESQDCADERRRPMQQLSDLGWRTWVSYEPALGPVHWAYWGFLNWFVSGGESGPRSRPALSDWYRGARDFCMAFDIPYLHKQNGNWIDASNDAFGKPGWSQMTWRRSDGSLPAADELADENADVTTMVRVPKKTAGRLLDGRLHDGYPETEQ